MNEFIFAVAIAFGAGCLFLCGGGLYLEVLSLRDKWQNFNQRQDAIEKGGNENETNETSEFLD